MRRVTNALLGASEFQIRKSLPKPPSLVVGLKNPISQGYMYFLTLTVVDWIDVFTRPTYKQDIVDSLTYCQQHKGLELYAWVLMTNHLHLVASAADGYHLSDILRDFKKFTNKKIMNRILTEPESRRKWMTSQFEFAGRYTKRIKDFKFWQDGNEPKEIHTTDFMFQKLNYIHDNPVRAAIVEYPEQYLHSSARNYVGQKGLLDVIVL